MDSKDFRLLALLHENARRSFRYLGGRMSLSAPAVRERLHRLETGGILQGYWLSIDPSLFERADLLVFFFQDEWTRQDALKALAARDVAWVASKLDGGLTVQLWPKDVKKSMEGLANHLGAQPTGHALGERHGRPVLSLAGWRIIEALIDDPTIPLRDLTESTNLSAKTVRKHLEQLVRDEAISILPRLGALADSGDLVYHLAVTGEVGLGELRRLLVDAVLWNETREPPMKYLFCRGNDLADVTSKTHLVSNLPGVESVLMTLNKEFLVAKEFVHSLVQEEIQNLEKPTHRFRREEEPVTTPRHRAPT